jgi:hypothetical protein
MILPKCHGLLIRPNKYLTISARLRRIRTKKFGYAVEMSILNGIDAAAEIRRREEQGKLPGHTPIIAVTGNARSVILVEVLAGAEVIDLRIGLVARNAV